ncbi:MAG: hypothetical protein BWK75_03290 [Candidatus Altiarchaeales archaeon A3]|nr:MAG: hypothetical protein BWK75_03290 [Candidatus Altiarchaeales archaeon A3]
MKIAIHQPNYIPWIGYFDKISKSDIFVFFDDVQFPRGKEFANRNRIKTPQGALWLTVPIKNKGSLLKINEMEINNDIDWNIKHWKTIHTFYTNSPFFHEYEQKFENILLDKWTKLCDLNVELIKLIVSILKIDTKLVFSSELKVEGGGTEKIINILKILDADEYLTTHGPGAQRYLDEDIFRKNNIKLLFHDFKHSLYPQLFGEFIPNLSICDLLFNVGSSAKEYFI